MPFETRAIRLDYGWSGFLQVQMDAVRLERPIVRAVLEDAKLSFFGLETLYEPDETSTPSSGPAPYVSIDEGYLYLQTAAGEVSAEFQAQGRLIEDGFVKAQIKPASLRHQGAYLNWSRGLVDLTFERGAVLGRIDVSIEQAELGALSAQMAQINADIQDRDGALQVMLTGSADSIAHGTRRGGGLTLDLAGQAGLPPEGELFDVLGALQALTLDVRAEEIVDGTHRLADAQLVADVKSDGRELVGPLAFEAMEISSEPAQMGAFSLSGVLQYDAPDSGGAETMGAVRYDGRFVARNINGTGLGLDDVLTPEALPAAVQPHAWRMQRVVKRAVDDFDFGASFALAFEAGTLTVRAQEPVLLQAASGLTVAMEPLAGQTWLDFDGDRLIVSGLVKADGGGGPDFQTYLNDVIWHNGQLEIAARDGVLEPWRVEGASVSALFGGLSYLAGPSSRFFVDGELLVSGKLAGISLEQTRLFGKVEGAQGSEGWRVQTVGAKCVGLTMGAAQSGTVKLSPFEVALCPVDGRFIRQEAGQTVGQIILGNIELPFSTIDSSGVFDFRNARLDWVSGDILEMTVRGDSLALPLQIADRSLMISSAAPAVAARIGDGPLKISAALDDTVFSGTMIPANVRADAFTFEGVAAQAGFEGQLHGDGVHISDFDEDPLYQPIITDLDGVLGDGRIRLGGTLLTERARVAIADFKLDMDLTELNGTANLDMRPLSFMPGGLQPTALSEQLRGVLINTRGSLGGQADFTILEGKLNGTGEIVLDDVSFDTLKTGTVTGVSGQIVFRDILELRSEPQQVLTIAELNPGVPLKNGIVQFQLDGADVLRLETAQWPFAGGLIAVQPTVWMVNGQNQSVMVEMDAIRLAELVETLKVPDLVAEGTVSGAFPIEFEGANILVREARLKADEQGGTISYQGAATAPIEGQNELADYAFDALKDFDFTLMELGLDGNLIGRLLLSIDLAGNNEAVLDGQSFKFGIKIDSDLLPLLTSLRNAPTESFVSEALALEREAQTREQGR